MMNANDEKWDDQCQKQKIQWSFIKKLPKKNAAHNYRQADVLLHIILLLKTYRWMQENFITTWELQSLHLTIEKSKHL